MSLELKSNAKPYYSKYILFLMSIKTFPHKEVEYLAEIEVLDLDSK